MDSVQDRFDMYRNILMERRARQGVTMGAGCQPVDLRPERPFPRVALTIAVRQRSGATPQVVIELDKQLQFACCRATFRQPTIGQTQMLRVGRV